MLAAAAATFVTARRERSPQEAAAPMFRPGRGHLAAGLALLLLVVVVASGALQERHTVRAQPATGATNERLTSLESTRYSYWRVAARAFAHHPLTGLGSGGFAAEWLRERDTRDVANDAHSLYVETAAELGLLGLLALALFLAGAGLSAAAAYRRAPVAATGAVAAVAAWAVHAGLDWDWEMPAVTLPALILLAALIAAGEAGQEQSDR
jgi:O-antigen ligase